MKGIYFGGRLSTSSKMVVASPRVCLMKAIQLRLICKIKTSYAYNICLQSIKALKDK